MIEASLLRADGVFFGPSLCTRQAMHSMEKEGRAPNDPSFAIGFWAARRLRDPDFAKMLLEMRSKAEYPPRQDFFVQASQGFPVPEAFSSGTAHYYVDAVGSMSRSKHASGNMLQRDTEIHLIYRYFMLDTEG